MDEFKTPTKQKIRDEIDALPSSTRTSKVKTPEEQLEYYWNLLYKAYKPFYSNDELKFDELAAFLQQKNIKMFAIKVWKLLPSVINNTEFNKKVTPQEFKETRVILSSLMIHKFPRDMLDENDINAFTSPLSEQLYDTANKLIESLMTGANNINDTSMKTLYNIMKQFLNHFSDWKQKDIQKLMESLKHVYTQWVKSHRVMNLTDLEATKKDSVLDTASKSMSNIKDKMVKLVGQQKAEEICKKIEDDVANEPEVLLISPTNASPKSENNDENEVKGNEPETIEQKLAAKGVPMNIKTGHNLVKNLPKQNNNNNDNNDESKYMEDYKGKKVLNLDKIIAEVSAKKYWDDFAEQIEQKNFKRLFELLGELLERIKKISPKKDHKSLDDLIDVSFIEQTIANGLLDAKGFYGIFLGIHLQLKSLHAPINDKIWDDWHDKIVQDMGKQDQSWSKLLPVVFNKFLMKVDEIEDQVNIIRNAVQNKNKQK